MNNYKTVFLMTDIGLIESSIFDLRFNNYIIFDLDENKNYLEKYQDADCKATILLPPPQSIIKLVEGRRDEFINEYDYYLNTNKEVEAILELMIVSIFSDHNVFLYVPESGPDNIWVNQLLKFIHNRFGLIVGTPSNGFYIDHLYTPYINYILYKYNLINMDTFMYTNLNVDISVYIAMNDMTFINKIIADVATRQPVNDIGDIIQYANWFKMVQTQSQSTIKPMISFDN